MKEDFERIETKIDTLQATINGLHVQHHGRISKLEANQKGIISVLGAILTAVLGSLAAHLGFKP